MMPSQPSAGSRRRAWRVSVATWLAFGLWLFSSAAPAQEARLLPERTATLEWTASEDELIAKSLTFRDVVTQEIRKKLSRGLPTTIVFTATLYQQGKAEPIATTAQSCKITWHVWHEAYRIELTRPGSMKTRWTTEIEGVLRRCAEVSGLLVATRSQLAVGQSVYLEAKVRVNPISPDLLKKIKQWVSRPARTGTAAPGDALFSTFTGLFMQRIGDAERTLEFRTRPETPNVQRKQPAPSADRTENPNEG